VKQRKVEVLHGSGRFVSANVLEVMGASGSRSVSVFDQCIIAAGSEPVRLRDYRRIREFSTPPTHSSCRSPPAVCWWWAAASSGWNWPACFDALAVA